MPKNTWRYRQDDKNFETEDWGRVEAWQHWRDLDWLACDDDDILLPDGADVVIYRDTVFRRQKPKGARRPDRKSRERWVRIGERLVIAEVIEFSPDPSDWVYLRILYCEGDEAEEYRRMLQSRDMETRKKRRNLHGLKRLAWSDEEARLRVVNDPEYSKFLLETEDGPT